MIKRLVNHIVALTVLLTVTSSLAAAEPVKKLMTAAILSESGLQKYGSLLTASLSPSQELALVERDRIDVIMAEGVNLINSADRRALGERLKADHLILLSGSKEAMQVTLCECVSGARIGRFTVSPEAVDMTTVAAKVLACLKRFSGGVKQIIAISTFYSLDLQHDYRQLELDLANALRDDLMKKKGIAVVEIDEAAEIANELDLTGGDVKKTAMTFVFGEYETVRQKTGDPLVQASITVVQNQAVAMHSTLDPLTINDAKKALQSALKKALTAKPSQTTADARIQFNHFVRQADRFAKIGELDRAIAFREAALLVAPPNSDRKDPQHLRLAFEYIRSFDRPYSGSGLTSESSREEELAYRGRAVRRMQRSLRHTEYIIRNQICSPVDAYQLIYHNARRMSPNYHSGYDRKTIGRNHLDVIDTLLPLLFKHRALGVPEIRKKIVAGSVAGNIYDLCAVGKGDEETQFVLKLLLQIVPEDMPVSSTIVYRMGDIGHRKYDTPEIQQDVDAFIMKLANSERPLPALYGKYALVKKRYLGDREVSEDLLKAAKHLEELVNTKAIAELDADGHFFRSQISETVTRIRHALKKKAEKAKPPKKITHSERKPPPPEPKAAPATEPRKPGPVSLPDGSLLCERVKLTPVNIEFKGELRGFDWMSFIPAWDDVDVLIKSHGLVFLHKDGSTRKIFGFGPVESLDRKGIAFDGKHLWVSGGYASGVYVLNKQGKTVAHAKKSDGMPPFYVNGILHATEPGRVFASGEINQGDRSWIAELTLKKNKVTIDVFHKARKAWKGDAAATDPFVRFEPTGMVSMMDQNSKKWLFIFRDYHWEPLLVDCQTKAVSIYPTGIGLKTCVYDRIAYYPNDAFARHADLNADGGRRYTFDSTKPLLARTEGARRMLSSDTQEASMIEYQGWLYCLGHYKWLRCNVKTNKVEILVENRRNSPGQGGPWAMAVSRQFGLVTWDWNKQTLYQLSVITEKAGNNRE